MFRITIRGQDPIFLEDGPGSDLFKKWSNDEKLPMKITAGNIAFFTADIRNIARIQKGAAELAPKTDTQEAEYQAFRRKMLDLTIEQRANIMRIANMVWASHTKDEMGEDTKKEIKARQLAYFKENPNCMYANPKIYRDLMPKPRYTQNIESLTPLSNILPTSMMRMIENVIQTDLQYSAR